MRLRLRDADAGANRRDAPWLEALLAGRPVDLLGWASELVGRGGLAPDSTGRVSVVICTGGSTLWPWFPDLLTDGGHFGGETKVLIDHQPVLMIARGLSRAFAIGVCAADLLVRLRERGEAIRRDPREGFLAEALAELSGEIVLGLLLGILSTPFVLAGKILNGILNVGEDPARTAAREAAAAGRAQAEGLRQEREEFEKVREKIEAGLRAQLLRTPKFGRWADRIHEGLESSLAAVASLAP